MNVVAQIGVLFACSVVLRGVCLGDVFVQILGRTSTVGRLCVVLMLFYLAERGWVRVLGSGLG